jgi:hypothetical protein
MRCDRSYDDGPLTFEALLTDPLIREVMARDGVGMAELLQVLEIARNAQVAREAAALQRLVAGN